MGDGKQASVFADRYRIRGGKPVRLKDFPTDEDDKPVTKKEGEDLLSADVSKLTDLQDKLYVHNRYALLIVIQGMDASGKDSVVKHVMSGLNPQGVTVTPFKTPTHQELEHDFLWRHYLALPARGMVGIFNRSHYENVLVTRVHPEYILNENLPGIVSVDQIRDSFWEKRFRQINDFEKTLTENGTLILKFFFQCRVICAGAGPGCRAQFARKQHRGLFARRQCGIILLHRQELRGVDTQLSECDDLVHRAVPAAVRHGHRERHLQQEFASD